MSRAPSTAMDGDGYAIIPTMPHVPDSLTAQERRELKRWEDRLAKVEQEREEARQAFAAWVRETGLYKVAREMDVPPDRLNQRLRLYEGKRRRGVSER